jgi:DNA invertase Pin-like site-specific DNA recombinase
MTDLIEYSVFCAARIPTADTGRPLNCAIYARTAVTGASAIEAQRNACAAHIDRQPDWTLVDERYDDEGFSGVTMDRPGLQRLLEDVEAGVADVVVARDAARLSRSSRDFVRILERFNAAGSELVLVIQ